MIDPSSSEEESDEDQSTHHGGGGGTRAAGGHGSRRHPSGGGVGPSAGAAGGTGAASAASGLTASPGGPSGQGGATGSPSLHGGSVHGPHGRNLAAGQAHPGAPGESGGPGLDVPNLSSARNSLSPSMGATQDAANYAKSAQRPTSPSPSVASEKTEADIQVSLTFSSVYVLQYAAMASEHTLKSHC